MNWNEMLLSILSIILTTLATWAVGRLTAWLNTKIKDKKALAFINEMSEVVDTAIEATNQTYVDNIKGTEFWDADAQKNALNKAVEIAIGQLSEGAKKYIIKNYGNLGAFLISKIESRLHSAKKNANK